VLKANNKRMHQKTNACGSLHILCHEDMPGSPKSLAAMSVSGDTRANRTDLPVWLADGFAFLYDFIMSRSVFPRKLGADIQTHYQTLAQELSGFHGRYILELGSGTGSAVHFLPNDNHYTGSDISPGLLKRAVKRFMAAGFPHPEFFVVSADDLPFEEGTYDLCLCILSLNFIGKVEEVLREVHRILLAGGVFIGCVPVPEKNLRGSNIRGTLHSQTELEKISRQSGFNFEQIPCENGALLYFRAQKKH